MKEIKTNEFEPEIQTGNVVVEFFGPGCGNCKMQEKIMEQIMPDFPDTKFLKLDVTTAKEIANQYKITTMPTLLVFNNGELKATLAGLKPKVVITKTLIS